MAAYMLKHFENTIMRRDYNSRHIVLTVMLQTMLCMLNGDQIVVTIYRNYSAAATINSVRLLEMNIVNKCDKSL